MYVRDPPIVQVQRGNDRVLYELKVAVAFRPVTLIGSEQPCAPS